MKQNNNWAATQLLQAVLIAVSLLVPSGAAFGDVITQWTFETSIPLLNDSATIGSLNAEVGTGTASGSHVSATTDWSNPVGNGSAESLSSNEWAVNDFYQFSNSTVGFENITLNWAQVSSGTGPGEFTLAYQVNGGGFTSFLDYTVLPNQVAAPGLGTWSSVTENLGYNFNVDLSGVSALDNIAAVDFRLFMRTTNDATPPGTVATGGTNRVDNFTINGTLISAVPEPSSLGLACFAGITMCLSRIRRKQEN